MDSCIGTNFFSKDKCLLPRLYELSVKLFAAAVPHGGVGFVGASVACLSAEGMAVVVLFLP